jgi:hypothetical protein
VTLVIGFLILATIGVAAFIALPRMSESRVVFNAVPDRPCSFGCDMAWIAVRTDDAAAVMTVLGVTHGTPSNWDSGIGTAYDATLGQAYVFISAPTRGWVFVVGSALPYPTGLTFIDKCLPLLSDLSQAFPDVQYFACYPEVDLFAWARLTGARGMRAFAASDEGVLWTRGKPTREERQLGLKLFELRGVRGRKGDAGGELLMHPTEEHVMRVAGHWSLNPTLLDGLALQPSLGTIAAVPASWRPERLRKTA